MTTISMSEKFSLYVRKTLSSAPKKDDIKKFNDAAGAGDIDRMSYYLESFGTAILNRSHIYLANKADALCAAAQNGKVESLRFLIEAGANMEYTGDASLTPLITAAKHGQAACFDFLLSAGANPNAADESGRPVLFYAATRLPYTHIAALLAAGADIHAVDNDNNGVLAGMMVWEISDSVVLRLIPNAVIIDSDEAPDLFSIGLYHPVKPDNMRLLIKNGAAVNAANHDGITPLMHLAAQPRAYTENVHILLENHAKTDITDENGSAAIHHAVSAHNARVLQALLTAGASPDLPDRSEYTPLILAAEQNFVEGAKILIKAKADIGLRNHINKSAHDIATEKGHQDMLALLDAVKQTELTHFMTGTEQATIIKSGKLVLRAPPSEGKSFKP